jgi:hypothetical protein
MDKTYYPTPCEESFMTQRFKILIPALIALIFLSVPSAALAADNQHPGFVDFDSLSGLADAQAVVDIRLGGWMMDLAKHAADEADDDDLRFLSDIDTIRVRVFEMEDKVASFRAEAEKILAELRDRDWEEFARVRSDDELVFIMVKGDETRIEGMTIVAIGDDNEAVFVNISGSIDPQDIARILNDEDLIHVNIDLES